MTIRNRTRIALIAGLLACAVACHKDPKADQLKALETAYQSGVFTKDEYEAKKSALVGTTPAPVAATPIPAPVSETPPPANDPAAAVPDPSAAPPGLSASAQPQPVASPTPVPVPVPVATPPVVKAPPPKPLPVAKPVPSTPPPSAPPPAPPPSNPPAPVATCTDAEPGGPAVQERYYNASMEAVLRAATVALRNLDFDIKQSSGREIEASKRRHLSAVVGAGGEKVTLRFDTTARGTRVTGETKKTFTGKLAQKAWTGAVLSQIACNLKGK